MKRIKSLMTWILVITCVAQASAAPVSKAEALIRAKAFMKTKGISFDVNAQVTDGPRRVSASHAESPYFYVFNNDNDEGFVIVSGDDRTIPIIGYSDKGHFDMDLINQNEGTLFDAYKEEIDLLDKKGVTSSYANSANTSTTPTTYPVRPMLKTQWGQEDPFNVYAPKKGGQPCCLGCTAVCLAQLAYYYKDRMEAKLPVAIPGYTAEGVTAPTVAAGTAFNWNNMLEVYDGKSSTKFTNTCKFLSYCAIALKSVFRIGETKGTSATLDNYKNAITTYFKFKSSYSGFTYRSGYSFERWKEMILDELYQGRPVTYSAFKASGVGHIFLLDGYDGGDFFHVNWGWGGFCDGFFSLTILNSDEPDMSDSSIGERSYLTGTRAYFDLQPIKGYNNENDNSVLKATISAASGTAATVQFANLNTEAAEYYLGLGYYDANGNIQLLKQYSTATVSIASNKYAVAKFTLAVTDFSSNKLAKGTYKLYPICKLKGTDEWVQCDQVADYNYISAVYSTTIKLTLGAASASLSATEFTFNGSRVAGQSQPVIVSVKNSGDDFYGYVSLYASTTTSMGSKRSQVLVYIPSGKTVNVQLSFKPSVGGTYNVWAVSGSTIGSSKISIQKSSSSRNLQVLKSSDVVLDFVKSGQTVLGTSLQGKINVYNKAAATFYGEVSVTLFYLNGSSWKSTIEKCVSNVTIPSQKYGAINFKYDNLTPGKAYALVVRYGDDAFIAYGYLLSKFYVTNAVMTYNGLGELKPLAPASTITLDANVTAVDLTGLTSTVTKVVPSSDPNALYFIGASEKVITGLSGKNIVKGDVADKITLTDGYPFYTHKDITAKTISYTRTSKLGTAGKNGWQTIVLPFAATSVTCNGKSLDWFRAANDTYKNFWLKEFRAIEGYKTVYFDYVQQFEANRPYLMAVPGNAWGESNNLVGKPMVFSASNVTLYRQSYAVVGSDVFKFRGSYSQQKLANTYCLNSDGSKFVLGTNTVNPFRCYFIASDNDNNEDYNELNIGVFEDESDGIFTPFASEGEKVSVYNLNGIKVGETKVVDSKIDLGNLPKGVYVINGKKFIK